MEKQRTLSMILNLVLVMGLIFSISAPMAAGAANAPLGQGDFLKTSGTVIRNNSGGGAVVNLRGTNLGGWLLHEGWMSPAGEAALNRAGWTASASSSPSNPCCTGDTPGKALDSNSSTRWSTGVPQASGQWFKVDMGSPRTFDQISLDAGSSTGDYPSSFNIEASNDNVNWWTVKSATGNGQNVVVVTAYTTARYIRITLTSGKGNWWSIHEFNAYVSDEFNTRRRLTERFGAATADGLMNGYHDTWIQAGDLDNIKNMGMNVVRVPIYWQVLMNTDGTMKSDSAAFRKLDWVITESSNRGLYVILDLHGTPGAHCPWQSCGQAGSNQLWTNATYQNWTVQIWQRIAARYRGNPAVAAYDLLNEPLVSMGAGETAAQVRQKFDFYDRLYDAVRGVDPDHIIMVAAFFGFGQALPPSTYGWTNVVYQTHHYNFGQANDWNAQNNLIEAGINDLTTYQQQWNVPVYAGEFWFSSYNDLFGKWLSALNAHDISWTNWAYKNKNSPSSAGEDGVPNGINWGFYLNNTNPIPDLNNDSAATISSKWNNFGTSNFQANTDLIDVFTAYTANYGWSSLKAMANNKYVSADLSVGGSLVADRTAVQGWEEFKIVNNPDGSVSFLSMANNKYITADLNQGGKLVAQAKGVLGWEKFWKITNADGTVSFQAQANNKYVAADLNNGSVLIADRTAISTWEKFVIAAVP